MKKIKVAFSVSLTPGWSPVLDVYKAGLLEYVAHTERSALSDKCAGSAGIFTHSTHPSTSTEIKKQLPGPLWSPLGHCFALGRDPPTVQTSGFAYLGIFHKQV